MIWRVGFFVNSAMLPILNTNILAINSIYQKLKLIAVQKIFPYLRGNTFGELFLNYFQDIFVQFIKVKVF